MSKSALVTSEWLAECPGSAEIRLVDASTFPPNVPRKAKQEYLEAHIPGAAFFDVDAIADTSRALPHMLPSPEKFGRMVGELGIGNQHTIIAYDSLGLFSAPRVWWMFRAMGHEQVFVLDGGLPKWQAEGRATTSALPALPPVPFAARLNPALVRTLAQVKADSATKASQLVDARSPGRFSGEEEEIWPGRRRGHIPGAANVFFGSLIDPARKTLLPRDSLEKVFAGLDLARPVTTTCGSGVTACVLALALFELGKRDVAVYDGAWAEWGLPDSGCPVEVGALSNSQTAL